MFQAFSDGAPLWYLGTPYTLTVFPSSKELRHPHAFDRITLKNGRFIVETGHPSLVTIERLVRTWYDQQAASIFKEHLDQCFILFQTQFRQELQQKFSSVPGVSDGSFSNLKPHLVIRFFKSRWGHMTRKRVMALNRELVHVPVAFIDAVIFHELVHILHFNHQKYFHDCLERLVPHHRQIHKNLGTFWVTCHKGDVPQKSESFATTKKTGWELKQNEKF